MHKNLVLFVCSTLLLPVVLHAQGHLTLQQALQVAKSNNPFLKPAGLSVAMAQADQVTAGLRPNPVLNNQTLQLPNSANFAPGTKFYQPQNRQVWWQLTKSFELSGQRKYRQQVAANAVAVEQKNYSNTERDVLLGTGDKWLDVWYSQVTLNLIREAKQNIDSLLKFQDIRLRNQVISNSEMLRTQLVGEQYQLQLKKAEQDYHNELQNLQLLLGSPVDLSIDTTDPVKYVTVEQQTDSLLSLSMTHRPDIQGVQASIDMAGSNIKLQQSLAKPAPELGVIYNPQNTVKYVGVFATIELPLFSRNQGEIKKSKIALEQSKQSLDALQLQVGTEVSNALRSWQLNKTNVETYKAILDKAAQVLQSVKYAYTRGGTSIVDFLDAQRTWYDTQKMYYETLLDYRKSYLQLLYVTGLINQL